MLGAQLRRALPKNAAGNEQEVMKEQEVMPNERAKSNVGWPVGRLLLAVRAHTLAKGMSGEENLERDKEKSGEGDRKRG